MIHGGAFFDPHPLCFVYGADVQRYLHMPKGKERDKEGRFIHVSPTTAFYAYLVCDFETDSDFEKAAKSKGMTKTPDGLGYFGFNPNYNTYLELMSFSKLLNDAKQRNRIFFQRLGIDRT